MGRWHGKIGYSVRVETAPDIYTDQIIEKIAYGTAKSLRVNWSDRTNSLLDDMKVNVQISVNADKYALEHFNNIKWIEYLGEKYKIGVIDLPASHRINLTLGGLWHENEN